MPVEFPRSAVPAQPFAVVEDPDEGEDDRHEADRQRRDQQRQETPVVLHVPSSVHGSKRREGGAGREGGVGSGPAERRAVTAPQPLPARRGGRSEGRERGGTPQPTAVVALLVLEEGLACLFCFGGVLFLFVCLLFCFGFVFKAVFTS